MTALIIIGSIAALIAIALISYAAIDIKYDESGGLHAWVRYGPIRIRLYPQPDKPLDIRKFSKKKRSKKKTATDKDASSSDNLKRSDNPIDIVRTAASLISEIKERLHRHFILIAREVDITVGTDDAAKTAITYGAVCAAIDALLGVCDATEIRLRNDTISVKPDFVNGKSSVRLRVTLKIRVIHAAGLIIHTFKGFIKKTELSDSANIDTAITKRSI